MKCQDIAITQFISCNDTAPYPVEPNSIKIIQKNGCNVLVKSVGFCHVEIFAETGMPKRTPKE